MINLAGLLIQLLAKWPGHAAGEHQPARPVSSFFFCNSLVFPVPTSARLNENPEIPFSKAFQLARERELAKIHSKDGSVSFEGRHTRPTPGTVQRPDRGLPRTRSPSGRTDSSRWTNWTQLCLEPRTLCSVQRRQDDLSGLDTAKKSLILARELLGSK